MRKTAFYIEVLYSICDERNRILQIHLKVHRSKEY